MIPVDWGFRNDSWFWDEHRGRWVRFNEPKLLEAYLAWHKEARHINPSLWDTLKYLLQALRGRIAPRPYRGGRTTR